MLEMIAPEQSHLHLTQAFMTVCLDMNVDQDVDIVFSEYIVNDGRVDAINNDRVEENERLVRRVLSLPKRPPMIMIQVGVWMYRPRYEWISRLYMLLIYYPNKRHPPHCTSGVQLWRELSHR